MTVRRGRFWAVFGQKCGISPHFPAPLSKFTHLVFKHVARKYRFWPFCGARLLVAFVSSE
jgi:hypothetical protein